MRTIQVTSPSNTRLKITRRLHSRSGISKHGLFLIEGPRFILDNLERSAPQWLILSGEATDLAAEAAGESSAAGALVLEVPAAVFDELSDTGTSQGLIGVFPLPPADIGSFFPSGLTVILDGVSDPGNMGAIIRSAAAFGCGGVIAGKGSCFPYIPKVTRSAAGTNTLLPIIPEVDLPAFMEQHAGEMEFLGAEASGRSIGGILPGALPRGLVVGSEAHGISPAVRALLNTSVAVPMTGAVESLNAAVSASILIYLLSLGSTVEGSRNHPGVSGLEIPAEDAEDGPHS